MFVIYFKNLLRLRNKESRKSDNSIYIWLSLHKVQEYYFKYRKTDTKEHILLVLLIRASRTGKPFYSYHKSEHNSSYTKRLAKLALAVH